MTKVLAAIAQAEVAPDLESGVVRTLELAAQAASAGARLVVFPETWLPGYPVWLDVCRDAALWNHPPAKAVFARMAAESVTVPGPAVQRIQDAAARLRITLVVGVTERVDAGPGRGTLYNTLLTIGHDGRLLNHHRKLVPTYSERMVWGNGDAAGLRAVDTAAGRVGGLICWEHWMPLARQALHQSGEDIHVAVWPTVHELHQVASRHYAFEGRCFVLAAGSIMHAAQLPPELEPDPARAGAPDQLVLRGGSAIFAPDGEVIAGPVYDRPELLIAELDLNKVREENMTLDVAGHYARPDIFDFAIRQGGRIVD